MASLSDRLKALGVNVGAQGLPTQPESFPLQPHHPASSLESRLHGETIQTPLGESFVISNSFPHGHPHGRAQLALRPCPTCLAAWANIPALPDFPIETFAFLDTETTGLSGGAGTLAFLIGVGRFIDNRFELRQFFLRDPYEEPAQLAALEAFLAPCQALVTFNGKAFDAPLLQTRFITHGWHNPLTDLAHVDLLHLARRLWKDRLPSRSLANLEVQILGAVRSGDDIPGWVIPSIYQDYLRTGNTAQMVQVLYHNLMDVISMVALLDHLNALLDDPAGAGGQYGVDLVSLGRLFEDLNDLEQAARLYLFGLEHEDVRTGEMPRATLLQALQRLANLHKKQAEWSAAIRLWEQAATHQSLDACIELAKCHEHHLCDIPTAITWTEMAMTMVSTASIFPADETYLPLYERCRLQEELGHRLERLQKKRSLTDENQISK